MLESSEISFDRADLTGLLKATFVVAHATEVTAEVANATAS